MEIASLVLEYLKLLLSAPVVSGVIILILTKMFKDEFAGLIRRIARIKLPGGSELFASQQKTDESEPERKPSALPEVSLPENITLTSDQAQQVIQIVQSERANAALWEYRYLNYFLAQSTQTILDWLATLQQPISLNLLDSHLQSFVADGSERKTIYNALANHHLISTDNNLVQITPKGREYLQWRGPLLQLN